jgi:hypothetical protein
MLCSAEYLFYAFTTIIVQARELKMWHFIRRIKARAQVTYRERAWRGDCLAITARQRAFIVTVINKTYGTEMKSWKFNGKEFCILFIFPLNSVKAWTSAEDRLKLFRDGRAALSGLLFVFHAVPGGCPCYFSRLNGLPRARKAREMKKLTSMCTSIEGTKDKAECELSEGFASR